MTMSITELRALPFGTVVFAIEQDRYYRKGRWETWHRIDRRTGERVGQRNAVRTDYLQMLAGPVTNTTAETERLSAIKESRR